MNTGRLVNKFPPVTLIYAFREEVPSIIDQPFIIPYALIKHCTLD